MAARTGTTERLLSIADISRHFSLPESTTRYYCKRFAAFIPSVGDGRRRRYRPETLQIISVILEQMQMSRTAQAVEEALEKRFPRNALAVQEAHMALPQDNGQLAQGFLSSAALQLIERQTRAIEGIEQVLTRMITAMGRPETHHDLHSESQKIRQEVDTLRVLLEASEKTQQADLEQLRQWMARVIQRGQAGAQASVSG